MNELPAGILLAAGQSTRFGSNKLLYPITDDSPMLMVSARKLASVLPGSYVVINPGMTEHAGELERLGLNIIVNEKSQQGMGSSIACGVRASQNASGWLIALADMPYITTETIVQVINQLKAGAGIVAPTYQGQRGHPVGFNLHYKKELLALENDIGARNIIAANHQQLELIETRDAGVINDIDHLPEKGVGN